MTSMLDELADLLLEALDQPNEKEQTAKPNKPKKTRKRARGK